MTEQFTKRTVNFRSGDWEYIRQICEPSGIKPTWFIRQLVAKWVDEMRARGGDVNVSIDVDTRYE
ncbi:hypothetical protein D6827_01655 [Candidatus Parcubacteria bacterium]|nr:MAG: hypothetical protein D6827_01655 [Candidatus Parcubacteria bacterium]